MEITRQEFDHLSHRVNDIVTSVALLNTRTTEVLASRDWVREIVDDIRDAHTDLKNSIERQENGINELSKLVGGVCSTQDSFLKEKAAQERTAFERLQSQQGIRFIVTYWIAPILGGLLVAVNFFEKVAPYLGIVVSHATK